MALVTQFLTSIRGYVKEQNGEKLRDWFQVEQGVPAQYFALAQELRTGFRAGTKALDDLVEKCLPEEDDIPDGAGSPWPSFISFVKDYMHYWRDIDFDDLLGLMGLLKDLLTSCATALSHPSYGTVMLETSIAISGSLSKLAMILNNRPDLTSKLRYERPEEEGAERKSIVERAADTIQGVAMCCLRERPGPRGAKPTGKRVGIYACANLVLKLLFTCRKSRLAVNLFAAVAAQGPPLSQFPASQRVTYLYYLGRFNFQNNHFLRASLCLEEAYLQTPPRCEKHRQQILTYLIPSNTLLGRFPTGRLLARPEARTLGDVFRPIIAAVKKGDFVGFHHAMKAHEAWLFQRGLHITLNYRLRPLIWRALSRRTFLLTYRPPEDAGSRKAATLDLADLLTAAVYQQRRLEGWVPAHPPAPRKPLPHMNMLFMRAVANNVKVSGTDSTLAPPPGGGQPARLRPSEGLLCGGLAVDLAEVEGVVANLAGQGLLHGYVSHAQAKFAVVGAKTKTARDAAAAGWPTAAAVIRDRLAEEGWDVVGVPAWQKD